VHHLCNGTYTQQPDPQLAPLVHRLPPGVPVPAFARGGNISAAPKRSAG
jgi:hypothetical protein